MNASRWTRENIAWAAGLFEGEGCFSVIYPAGVPRFNLIVQMTDKDVIDRLHSIAGFGNVCLPTPDTRFPSAKQIYRWSAFFDQYCIAFMYALYPLMGERRRAKIESMIAIWVAQGPRIDSLTARLPFAA